MKIFIVNLNMYGDMLISDFSLSGRMAFKLKKLDLTFAPYRDGVDAFSLFHIFDTDPGDINHVFFSDIYYPHEQIEQILKQDQTRFYTNDKYTAMLGFSFTADDAAKMKAATQDVIDDHNNMKGAGGAWETYRAFRGFTNIPVRPRKCTKCTKRAGIYYRHMIKKEDFLILEKFIIIETDQAFRKFAGTIVRRGKTD